VDGDAPFIDATSGIGVRGGDGSAIREDVAPCNHCLDSHGDK
jgi:hypothetical protein